MHRPGPRFFLCFLFLLTPAALHAADAPAPSPVPKGEVKQYTFAGSKIFPGTVRKYWVYVPRKYDPAKPACLYVNQDGVQFKAPEVFDELIARKEIPVLIAVFVQPGVVPAASKNALPRFNRSYEYDGLGDNYARFLLEELLPEVERKKTADGRPIRLSSNGNDRAIGGSSSGAICAFTAAWERPDSFRRVFSSIGTYVGLRGGNVYPTLIRKFEPKPLRVFLQDGSGDLNIYGGDWWMANQEMERALRFAGYEVNHSWGTGGHNGAHATKIFPEAMRWLWKDWPAPVKAGKGSGQLREILMPGEGWQQVGEVYDEVFTPAANAKGEVFFQSHNKKKQKVFKIGLDEKVRVFLSDREFGAGLAFGPDGRLYGMWPSVNFDDPQAHYDLCAYDASGKPSVVAKEVPGDFLIVRHDGGIYLTDPGLKTKEVNQVWYISPKGKKQVVDKGFSWVSGVTLSPDQSLLYVADARSHWVYSYQIKVDGTLAFKQRYYHLHTPDNADDSGAQGMCVDRDGRLYVATRMGIQVCDQAGRVNCIITVPKGRPRGLCFGGEDFDTLFVTCVDRVYKRKLKVKGAQAFQAPIKPKPPRL